MFLIRKYSASGISGGDDVPQTTTTVVQQTGGVASISIISQQSSNRPFYSPLPTTPGTPLHPTISGSSTDTAHTNTDSTTTTTSSSMEPPPPTGELRWKHYQVTHSSVSGQEAAPVSRAPVSSSMYMGLSDEASTPRSPPSNAVGRKPSSGSEETTSRDEDAIQKGLVGDRLKLFGGGAHIVRSSPTASPVSDVSRRTSADTPSVEHKSPSTSAATPQMVGGEPRRQTLHVSIDRSCKLAATQTEVLVSPSGDTTLLERGNYRANIQVLIAELDAAKDLNKKLSLQLARAERDVEKRRIECELNHEQIEAIVASRLADSVSKNGISAHGQQHTSHNGHAHETPSDEALLSGRLSPATMAHNADRMLDAVRRRGCQNATDDPDEITFLRSRLEVARENLGQKSLALETRERDVQRLQESVQQLQTENANLTRQKADAEQNRHATSTADVDAMSELRLQKAEAERRLERAEQEREELRLSLNTVGDQLAAAKSKEEWLIIDNQQSRIINDNRRLQDSTKTEEELLREFQQEREELQASITRIEEQLDLYKSNNRDLKSQVERLNRQLQSHESDRQNVKTAHEYEEQIATLRSANRELSQQLEREAAEKEEVNLRLDSAAAELASVRRPTPPAVDDQLQRLQLELVESRDAAAEQQRALTAGADVLQNELTKTRELLDEQQKEAQAERRRADELTDENARLLEQLATDRTELTDRLTRVERELEHKCDEVTLNSSLVTEERQQRQQLEEQLTHLKELAADRTVLEQQVAEMEQQLVRRNEQATEQRALEQALGDAGETARRASDDLKVQRQQVVELTAERDRLREQLATVDESEQTVTILLNDKQRLQADVEELRSKSELLAARSNQELYDLRQRLEDAETQSQSSRDELEKTKREKERLAEEMQAKLLEVTSVRSAGHNNGDIKDQKTENEIQKLKEEVEKQQRLVVVLRRKLTQLAANAHG